MKRPVLTVEPARGGHSQVAEMVAFGLSIAHNAGGYAAFNIIFCDPAAGILKLRCFPRSLAILILTVASGSMVRDHAVDVIDLNYAGQQ